MLLITWSRRGLGPAKIAGKDTMLEFKFEDSFMSSGTGTIAHGGENIIVSMKTTRVADPHCLVFTGRICVSGESGRRRRLRFQP